MSLTSSGKSSGLKPWLWFVLIWILSVAALGLLAWLLRWLIRP